MASRLAVTAAPSPSAHARQRLGGSRAGPGGPPCPSPGRPLRGSRCPRTGDKDQRRPALQDAGKTLRGSGRGRQRGGEPRWEPPGAWVVARAGAGSEHSSGGTGGGASRRPGSSQPAGRTRRAAWTRPRLLPRFESVPPTYVYTFQDYGGEKPQNFKKETCKG